MLQNEDAISISISSDEMAAYVMLWTPTSKDDYTLSKVRAKLSENGVVYGVAEDVINKLIAEGPYEKEVQVAFGTPVVEGIDGYYEYNFKTTIEHKPQIRKDGTVDYWSMNVIETVVAGQVIATYHPAVTGSSGRTVTGKELVSRVARELSPLKGRGFERNNDNLTYVASIDGKIEMANNRINIIDIFEIYGNVDAVYGDVQFAGDIVIHGNICSGMNVRTNGTLTVDGVVEGANIRAGKDIILRGGVLGEGKGEIFAKGNIFAKFFEFAKITCYGSIEADVLLQCEVECKKQIILKGKKGAIIGGTVRAVQGLDVNDIGNDSEISTNIEVGIVEEVFVRMRVLTAEVARLTESLEKIDKALAVFARVEEERGVSYRNHPGRMKLLRARIQDSSTLKATEAELHEYLALEQASKSSTIKVNRTVYPGTSIVIGLSKVLVKEPQIAVEYVRRADKVVLKGDMIVG